MLDRRMGKFRIGAGLVRGEFEIVAKMFALYKLLPIDVQYDIVDNMYIYTVLGNVLTSLPECSEPPAYRFNIENIFEGDYYHRIPISYLTLQLLDGTILKREWKEVDNV